MALCLLVLAVHHLRLTGQEGHLATHGKVRGWVCQRDMQRG